MYFFFLVGEGNNIFECLLFIIAYAFIFGCTGSLLLCSGFLQLQWVGATLHCSVQASHCSGFSCCGAQILGTWASVFAAQGLNRCSAWALIAHAMCSLPGPGTEPMSPALSDGVLSTVSPGKLRTYYCELKFCSALHIQSFHVPHSNSIKCVLDMSFIDKIIETYRSSLTFPRSQSSGIAIRGLELKFAWSQSLCPTYPMTCHLMGSRRVFINKRPWHFLWSKDTGDVHVVTCPRVMLKFSMFKA